VANRSGMESVFTSRDGFARGYFWGGGGFALVAGLVFASLAVAGGTLVVYALTQPLTPSVIVGSLELIFFGLVLAVGFAVLLLRWAWYGFRRRPIELRVGAEGIVIRDASGLETRIPYDSPSLDTLPWFYPPGARTRSWMSVPGAGQMIWIPPEASRLIHARSDSTQ
jgi:hypothetical protein